VAAEVDEVEGAEFAGNLDDAHIARGAGEDGHAGDIGTGEAEPEVGDGGVGLGGVGRCLVGVDQMLPSCCVVAGVMGPWSLGVKAGRVVVLSTRCR
jgi:hypothetical protein